MAVSESVLNAVNLFSSTSVFNANKGSVGATDLNFIKQTTAELATEGGGIIAQSLGTNGYVKFANGLILQWGCAEGSPVAYPIAFTLICYIVLNGIQTSSSSGQAYERGVFAVTKTNFSRVFPSPQQSYIAIGI